MTISVQVFCSQLYSIEHFTFSTGQEVLFPNINVEVFQYSPSTHSLKRKTFFFFMEHFATSCKDHKF